MTVQELIDQLTELPEQYRALPVIVDTEDGGGEAKNVRACLSGLAGKWWEADQIIISSVY